MRAKTWMGRSGGPRRRQLAFRAMNCQMAIWLATGTDQARAHRRLAAARRVIRVVEARLTRFRASELTRLNASGGRPVVVSATLWSVLRAALALAQETGGLYDPTVLPALEAAGYVHSFERLRAASGEYPGRQAAGAKGNGEGSAEGSGGESSGHLSPSRPQPTPAVETGRQKCGYGNIVMDTICQLADRNYGPPARWWQSTAGHHRQPFSQSYGSWQQVQLGPESYTVRLPPPLRLDLGGMAKGWAAERAADRLAEAGACLVDAGGDLAVRGSPPDAPGWAIGVVNPFEPQTDLCQLVVADCGVATSGIDYRYWQQGGRWQHHIVDPRTGRPAQTDLLTATVVAGDAVRADGLALVALLLGSAAGRHFLEQHQVEGLLVDRQGRVHHTPGLVSLLAEPAWPGQPSGVRGGGGR